MKPLRTSEVIGAPADDIAVPVRRYRPSSIYAMPIGAGHRTPAWLLSRDERDRYLIDAAAHFPGLTQREIARRLRTALTTYRNGRWQRDRVELTCPLQHKGKLTAVLWALLKTSDAIPGDKTIRDVLSRAS